MPVLEQPSDVLRQFCHGDLDAFEALFRQHQGEVHGWIVRIDRSARPTLSIHLSVVHCTGGRCAKLLSSLI